MDRILLVEDDVEVRPLLEDILMDNGFRVATAENVAIAITLLSSQPFDLGICDVKLPDGSGLTVAPELLKSIDRCLADKGGESEVVQLPKPPT